MSKQFSDQEQVTVRTAFAVLLVALSRGRVPLGPDAQRLAKEAWDAVRLPDDPPLAIHQRKVSPIALPFGDGFH